MKLAFILGLNPEVFTKREIMIPTNTKLLHGDCLELMKQIPDGSVDMILCDLPYGTTSCAWDTIIPFEPLWEQYKRVIKKKGAIVLFASQPFTTKLISSNIDIFKYCWYWNKGRVTGFANAKIQPLRCIEDVVVFCKTSTVYNPQGLLKCDIIKYNGKSVGGETLRGNIDSSMLRGSLRTPEKEYIQEFTNYPKQIIKVVSDTSKLHPTQKPVELLEYLIKTYTNEGETILDNTMGSGSTGVACINTKRNFIGIEKDDTYFELAKNRIETHQVKEVNKIDLFSVILES